MTDSSPTSFSSETIHRCECFALHGGDAYPGVLTISARRVSFMPLMESMEVNIEPWSITLTELEEVEIGGFEGILSLTTANTERKVMGIDLEAVRDALVLIIDGDASSAAENRNILLQGPIDIYTSGVLVASGEVILTNEVFEFKQGRGLEELIWGDLTKNIELKDIQRCEVVGVRRRLEIVTSEEKIHFRGPIVNHLYSVMATLGVGSASRLDHELKYSWEASLFTGPIAQKGEIGITEGTFRFTPTGMVESLLGVRKMVDVPISHIKRIGIIGVLDKRLVVSTRGSRVLSFQINKPLDRMRELGAIMMVSIEKDEPVLPSVGIYNTSPQVEAFLKDWGSRIGDIGKEQLIFMGAGVQAVGEKSIRRGWLLLTEKHVAFLPSCGDSKTDEPLISTLSAVSKPLNHKTPSGRLSLLFGKQNFSFIPAGGAEFIQEFGRCLRSAIKSKKVTINPTNSNPTGTGLVNRRETYRALLLGGLPLQLSFGGGPKRGARKIVVAKLNDISLGGCSVITDESLPPRIELEIEFDIEGQRVVVNGRSIYSIRLGRKKISWRHGVVFLDMGYKDAQCIRDLVMGLQREEIVQSHEN
tara:strand:+ start:166 stop:1926 length:1761 start_codon:yes stop_codon:yes gene_type:complete